jgi:ribosomal-protein-alanine N-acetyltransferase
LAEGPVGLRPIRRRDMTAWREVRRRNTDWLRPWEATQPDPQQPAPSFPGMVATLRSEARAGRVLPFIVTYDGRLVGQLTVGGVSYGSLRAAHIGYWVDQAVAGQGVIPTAVALAADHAYQTLQLHRLEIAMRPENFASKRVAEKLGFRFEGLRPRYLHIDGDWRDHLVFALHVEEMPDGVLARWRETRDG